MPHEVWSSKFGLIGVDGDGELWRGDRSGWFPIGEVPGEPQVLDSDGPVLLVAVTGAGDITEVHSSVDGGRRWSEVFRDAGAE